jgi:hypothetical protein
LRAGAATADESVAKAHREHLNAHYEEPRPGDATRTLGRYLMSLEPRSSVLSAASSPDDRCKAAYFFGLQEIVRGRYEDASEWFQLVYGSCTATWSWRLVSFAGARMSEWYTFDQDLDIAAERKIW